MRYQLLLFVGLLLCSLNTNANSNNSVKFVIDGVCIEIQFYSPQIVRVLKYPRGINISKESLSVIKTPSQTSNKIKENSFSASITTSALKISIDKKTGQVNFSDLKGKNLLQEQATSMFFTPNNGSYKVKQSFALTESEAIYGLGQHQKGIMNQRNQRLYLKQSNTEIAIPFYQSTRGYGLFWDNYSATWFEDNPKETSFESEAGDCIDYYFIQGENADSVISGYRKLTGEVPMFPLWTFGYWQSRERYKSQFELVDVVKKYRDLKVPLDGIIQDWQYWGRDNKQWNSTEFGNPLFPNPKSMVDSVHKLNAHIIISVWPSFGSNSNIYKELDAKGMLYDFLTYPVGKDIKVFDAFNPEARNIYWKHINKNLFSIGIDGWWLDATEPVMKKLSLKTTSHENEVSDMLENPVGVKTYLGDFSKYANAYPLESTSGIYKSQRATNNNKRVFILTRSAFAGQQRNATMLWSGDIKASWQVLKKQISAGVNLSLSGIPYWNTDIGGFFTSQNFPLGVKDPAYQELYVRWLQFAAFTPMFRSHGTQTPREIYHFGKKGDIAYDIIEKYINLRYLLLPYIYSTSWEVTSHSSSMMRGLMMDFKEDPKALHINDQYLFGKSILVAPITDSLVNKKIVYLPKGTSWTDFWTGEQYTGGQEIQKEISINTIPLFVKAGSIIPMGPAQQYVGEKNNSILDIRIYKGANGVFTLYEDENDNYQYEKGVFSEITFKWDDKKQILTIEKIKGSFPGMLKTRTFNLLLVSQENGLGDKISLNAHTSIKYSGKKLTLKL